MNKQRICIVGDGLAGLMTAVALGRIPEVDINLIAKKEKKNLDKRETEKKRDWNIQKSRLLRNKN